MQTSRIVGVIALAALLGGPVAGTVCAMRCAPHRLLSDSSTATAAAHHCAPNARRLASLAATGCDTHGSPDRDLQATLTTLRSQTHHPSTVSATLLDRASLSLASVRRTPCGHSPPLDTSPTPGSRALVLRV